MRKPWLIFLLSAASHAADVERLIPALIKVESQGNNNAIGNNGKAVGCLQIHSILVKDVNRISGKHFTLADRYNREKSIEMCEIYLNHYAANKSNKDAARMWNGGPNGHTKNATLKYWKKVQDALK